MPSRTTSLFEKYHGFNKFANRNFQSGLVENVNFPIPEVNYVGQSDGQNHSTADQHEEHDSCPRRTRGELVSRNNGRTEKEGRSAMDLTDLPDVGVGE